MLKTLKARGTYLVAKIIQLELSPAIDIYLQLEIYISSKRYIFPARYIYFQLEIDIYLQLDRHISLDRDRHLKSIKKLDFVDIIFVLNFELLILSNRRYSLSAYVFSQQEIDI